MSNKKKIKHLPELLWSGGVLAHGCFDLVHIGHIRHLLVAKELCLEGEPLIVTITADRFIQKGLGRPAFLESVRAEWLAALECVDYVAIVEEPTAVSAILTIRPRFYVKGNEYIGKPEILEEIQAVLGIGGEIVYLPGETFSSTKILNGMYLNECEQRPRTN